MQTSAELFMLLSEEYSSFFLNLHTRYPPTLEMLKLTGALKALLAQAPLTVSRNISLPVTRRVLGCRQPAYFRPFTLSSKWGFQWHILFSSTKSSNSSCPVLGTGLPLLSDRLAEMGTWLSCLEWPLLCFFSLKMITIERGINTQSSFSCLEVIFHTQPTIHRVNPEWFENNHRIHIQRNDFQSWWTKTWISCEVAFQKISRGIVTSQHNLADSFRFFFTQYRKFGLWSGDWSMNYKDGLHYR